jgi:hypothetical protein
MMGISHKDLLRDREYPPLQTTSSFCRADNYSDEMAEYRHNNAQKVMSFYQFEY